MLPVYVMPSQSSEEDLTILQNWGLFLICVSDKNVASLKQYAMLLSSFSLPHSHQLLSPCGVFLIPDVVQKFVSSTVAIIIYILGHGYLVNVVFSWHQKFEVKYFELIFNILKMLVLLIVDYCSHFELLCNPVACETTSKYTSIYMWVQWKLEVRLHREDLAKI